MQTNSFKKAEKIVVKIGSSLIINKSGGVKKQVLKNISEDIDQLLKKKKEVIVVSSGAIALGKKKLGLADNISLNQSRAAAARGQIELISSWKNEFKKLNRQVAQILLSPSDTQNKKSSSNAIATLNNLLKLGCIPIINENDTTATEEIKFGDNDILAARISKLINADCLILLSNVDGLYTNPPSKKEKAVLVENVLKINKRIIDMAGEASRHGKGGMISKIKAAEICLKEKCSVIITSGSKKNPIISLSKLSTKATRFN